MVTAMTENQKDINLNMIVEKYKLHISVILSLIIIGFVIFIQGFGDLQLIFWNRIKYTTGSAWKNAYPIFYDLSVIEIVSLVNSAYITFLLGLITQSFGIMIYLILVLKKRLQNKYVIAMTTIALIMCIFSLFMCIWLKLSIEIIASFPSIDAGMSGSEWINIEIGNYTAPLIVILNIMFYVYSLFVFTFIVVFSINLKNIRANQSEDEILLPKNDEFVKMISKRDLDTDKISKRTLVQKKKFFSISTLLNQIAFYSILILYLIFTLFPIYLTLKTSISSASEISYGFNPQDPIRNGLINFSTVIFASSIEEPNFMNALKNSLIIGLGTGMLGLIVSVTSAYALARFKFKGNNFLTFLILSTQMFPAIILLIPQYVIWTNLGLLERNVVVLGVLLASAAGATAYCTWMMKGYFETIPVDIEEAARIDGSSRFGTFLKIALPLAKSGLVAVLVFTFLTSWQEFVLARTFIGESDPQATLPLLFYQYQNPAAPDTPTFYELLTPYAILVALPVVIFFMFIQKQLASGAVAGGVK